MFADIVDFVEHLNRATNEISRRRCPVIEELIFDKVGFWRMVMVYEDLH
jgi:hypothetical protein